MKKRFLRMVSILLAFCLLFSASGCNAPGYKVTGKIEDGKLVVWLSPIMTRMYSLRGGYIPSAMAEGTDFCQDVNIVTFSSADEFQQSMAQKIMAGEPPDVILATPDELSSKTITSGMLTDLWPFFDYADKAGTIRKDNLMTQVMNKFMFDGKLYTVPLMFSISAIAADPEKDKNKGLNLLAQPNITPENYLSQIYQWLKKNDEDHFYQVCNLMPNIFYAWDHFIDYKKHTTRMSEDQVYQYFCRYVKNIQIADQAYDVYHKLTGKTPKGMFGDPDVYKWYSETCIYKTWGMGYTRSETRAALTENPNKGLVYLPYVTDAGTGYIAGVSTMAAIPANSDKKEKAFAFISTAFNPNVLNFYKDAFEYTPMLKSVIKTDIEDIKYLDDAQKSELYDDITENDCLCTWIDPQIDDWFNDYYGYNKTTHLPNKIVPTRKQWDALQKKIELYLGE